MKRCRVPKASLPPKSAAEGVLPQLLPQLSSKVSNSLDKTRNAKKNRLPAFLHHSAFNRYTAINLRVIFLHHRSTPNVHAPDRLRVRKNLPRGRSTPPNPTLYLSLIPPQNPGRIANLYPSIMNDHARSRFELLQYGPAPLTFLSVRIDSGHDAVCRRFFLLRSRSGIGATNQGKCCSR